MKFAQCASEIAHFVCSCGILNFPLVIARSNEVATWQSSVAKCGFALIPTLTLGMMIGIFEYSIEKTAKQNEEVKIYVRRFQKRFYLHCGTCQRR